jgi:hypothetical protein
MYVRQLIQILAEQATSAVERIVICTRDIGEAEQYKHEIFRELSRSGVPNSVVYVLGSAAAIRSQIAQHVLLDREAGIQVKCLLASDLPDEIDDGMLVDLTIVDRRVVARAPVDVSRQQQGQTWVVSVEQSEVIAALATYEGARKAGSNPESITPALDLEEPLAQSAPLIDEVSQVLCGGNHIDNANCSWYHGVWQYLRLMDLVSTPSWHHKFYSEELEKAVALGGRRILVTGTADYSVYAYVLDALQKVGVSDASITVVDLCSTPLFACNWYAKQMGGIQATGVAQDLLEFSSETGNAERFDIIVTDAFLTRFPAPARIGVLNAWLRLLSVNGVIITTVRAHAEAIAGRTLEEAVAQFGQRATKRWRKWSSLTGVPVSEVSKRAEYYAREMVSNAIGDEASVVRLLEEKFDVVSHELAAVPGELVPTKYLRVIMKRRI